MPVFRGNPQTFHNRTRASIPAGLQFSLPISGLEESQKSTIKLPPTFGNLFQPNGTQQIRFDIDAAGFMDTEACYVKYNLYVKPGASADIHIAEGSGSCFNRVRIMSRVNNQPIFDCQNYNLIKSYITRHTRSPEQLDKEATSCYNREGFNFQERFVPALTNNGTALNQPVMLVGAVNTTLDTTLTGQIEPNWVDETPTMFVNAAGAATSLQGKQFIWKFDFVGLMKAQSFLPNLAMGGVTIELTLESEKVFLNCKIGGATATYIVSNVQLVYDQIKPPKEYVSRFINDLQSENGVSFHFQTWDWSMQMFPKNVVRQQYQLPIQVSSLQGLFVLPRKQACINKGCPDVTVGYRGYALETQLFTDVNGYCTLSTAQLQLGGEFIPIQPIEAKSRVDESGNPVTTWAGGTRWAGTNLTKGSTFPSYGDYTLAGTYGNDPAEFYTENRHALQNPAVNTMSLPLYIQRHGGIGFDMAITDDVVTGTNTLTTGVGVTTMDINLTASSNANNSDYELDIFTISDRLITFVRGSVAVNN